jgi:hypothetical protein
LVGAVIIFVVFDYFSIVNRGGEMKIKRMKNYVVLVNGPFGSNVFCLLVHN